MLHIVKRVIAATLVIAMFAVFPALSEGEKALNIVCTSFPCYDFVRAVTGDSAKIHLLIKPGMEVHSFDPMPSDIIAIMESDLFVYIGGESDAWVLDILESMDADSTKTVRLFDCVEALEAESHGHDHEDAHEYDEHIWTSPVNACAMVKFISDTLCIVNADAADAYVQNADAYIAEISEIDNQVRDTVENAKRREMVFADRFPFLYFAKEYGLECHSAFPSCASESEPSAKTIAMLIEKLSEDEIPVIYTLEMSNGKTAKTIAGETGAKIRTFHSVQNVTEAEFSAGESYVSLMRKNIDALREGLN